MNRRQLLAMIGATGVLVACGDTGWARGPDQARDDSDLTRKDAVRLSDAEWKKHLTPPEFRILREAGTERAFTSPLLRNKKQGVYTCAGCGLPLFDSKTKFKSGTGWPSFYAPIAKDRVLDRIDRKLGMIRTENVCARCGGHLGHVFPDGPEPTGLRYCMNGLALDFVPKDELHTLKGEPVKLGGFDVSKAKQTQDDSSPGGMK